MPAAGAYQHGPAGRVRGLGEHRGERLFGVGVRDVHAGDVEAGALGGHHLSEAQDPGRVRVVLVRARGDDGEPALGDARPEQREHAVPQPVVGGVRESRAAEVVEVTDRLGEQGLGVVPVQAEQPAPGWWRSSARARASGSPGVSTATRCGSEAGGAGAAWSSGHQIGS
ncbi:hypothetical protein SAZ11_02805 [Streptomyces sp. FXJ1.4098]|nr:hypothetical protein [Streptomyces sp. FXJ1.4098]